MYFFREDKDAWFGETQDKKIGFFKSQHVEEVLDYDILHGKIPIYIFLFL